MISGLVELRVLPERNVDATLRALTLSCWKSGLSAPVTMMLAAVMSDARKTASRSTISDATHARLDNVTVSSATTEKRDECYSI